MEKKKFLDLMMGADAVAQMQYADALQEARIQAARAKVSLSEIDIKDARRIGMEDELIKLQRNADALEYLLSMAHDAAQYIRSAVREICLANDVAELHRTEHEAALRKQQAEQQRKAKENAKYRAKKKDQAEDPDQPEDGQEE